MYRQYLPLLAAFLLLPLAACDDAAGPDDPTGVAGSYSGTVSTSDSTTLGADVSLGRVSTAEDSVSGEGVVYWTGKGLDGRIEGITEQAGSDGRVPVSFELFYANYDTPAAFDGHLSSDGSELEGVLAAGSDTTEIVLERE